MEEEEEGEGTESWWGGDEARGRECGGAGAGGGVCADGGGQGSLGL